MATTKKMLLVTDAAGKIVAAAHLSEAPQRSSINVGIRPLPGQQAHEVDVPEELTRLTSGHAFYLALSHATFTPCPGKIHFKPSTSEKLGH